MQDIATEFGFTLKQLDPQKMVYSLTLARPDNRYRQRPLTHLLQLFGRAPTREDIAAFSTCAEAGGYTRDPNHGHHYDSAILLASIPSRSVATFDEADIHTASIGDYVAEIEKITKAPVRVSKRLVISGAIPDCEPEFQQNLSSALHAVAEAALRAGLGISFGAHPTFQFMLFDLARRLRPQDFREALRMYVSKHFVKGAVIEESQLSAEVRATDALEGADARAISLTIMRKAMLSDPDAGVLVVIGGKSVRPGIPPGIDEEIALARSNGLPVFIIGSVGGRSSQIMGELTATQRRELNGQSDDVNEAFAISLDYSRLAQVVVGILSNS